MIVQQPPPIVFHQQKSIFQIDQLQESFDFLSILLSSALQRVMAGCQEEDWLYWGAETSSEDGQKGM